MSAIRVVFKLLVCKGGAGHDDPDNSGLCIACGLPPSPDTEVGRAAIEKARGAGCDQVEVEQFKSWTGDDGVHRVSVYLHGSTPADRPLVIDGGEL